MYETYLMVTYTLDVTQQWFGTLPSTQHKILCWRYPACTLVRGQSPWCMPIAAQVQRSLDEVIIGGVFGFYPEQALRWKLIYEDDLATFFEFESLNAILIPDPVREGYRIRLKIVGWGSFTPKYVPPIPYSTDQIVPLEEIWAIVWQGNLSRGRRVPIHNISMQHHLIVCICIIQ